MNVIELDRATLAIGHRRILIDTSFSSHRRAPGFRKRTDRWR